MFFITCFNKRLRLFVLLLLLQLINYRSFCQDNVHALTTSFTQYNQYASIEQLFVHTDKAFYIAGEIMWFKVYATDITTHKPIDVSKVAYAEVLDTNHTPVLQAAIALNKSTGNGSLYLPLTLHSGNYIFRVYTNWMKNGGPDCFFQRNITIVNVQNVMEQPEKKSVTYDAQFFPEGGNLVAGLESKIAFKVWDSNGKGAAAKGTITDNGNPVVQFTTSHAGMGAFVFTPRQNHTYKAVLQTSDGNTVSKDLPTVYASGMVMHVYDEEGQVKVRVQSANNTNDEVLYLIVHAGTAIKIAEMGALQKGNANFVINPALLNEGVSHITIFNAARQPVCERLYFKKPGNYLNISTTVSQQVYEKRKEVNMKLSVPDLIATDTAMLSMAVCRIDALNVVDKNNIAAYLLLTSQLKGTIEDVAYYFDEQHGQSNEDLDNLLLVNGWSRFKWDAILQNSKPAFTYVPEYNGHIITGKVVNNNGVGIPNVEAYLSVPGLRTQFVSAVSDSAGRVQFEMKDCFGANEIIAQNKAQNNQYKIQIDNPFSTAYSAMPVPTFNLQENTSNTLLDQSISMQVQNIYTAGKLRQFSLPQTDTAAFYLHADAKYLLDNYTRFSTMEEVLREYVALVNLTKRSGAYHIQVYDKGNEIPFTKDPLVLLDGVPVLDFNKLLTVDPLKVKSLEVVQRRYYYGISVFDGILNWKTYNGDLANYELDPSALIMDYEGVQMNREFYSPVYNNNDASHIPDFRNVLYWNPDIELTKSKEQSYSFFTSDLAGKYAVIVQGVSANGRCGSAVATFEVKE